MLEVAVGHKLLAEMKAPVRVKEAWPDLTKMWRLVDIVRSAAGPVYYDRPLL